MAADRPDLRLSDAERQDALDALSEHVRAGRLDLTEFEERSGKVSTAKFRGDLEPSFADLPEPTPSALRSVRRLPPPVPPMPQAPPPRTPATWQRSLSSLAVPLAVVVAVVLVFTVARGAFFLLILLPIVAAMITRGRGPRRRRRY